MRRTVSTFCSLVIFLLVQTPSYSEGIRRAIIQKMPEDIARICADAYVTMAETNPKMYERNFGVPLHRKGPEVSREIERADEQAILADRINHRMWLYGSDYGFQDVLQRMDQQFEPGTFLALTEALLQMDSRHASELIPLLHRAEWKTLAELKSIIFRATGRHEIDPASGLALIRKIEKEIATPSKFESLTITRMAPKEKLTLYQVRFTGKLPYRDISMPRTAPYDVLPMQTRFLLEQYGVSRYQFAESWLPWGKRGFDYWKDPEREKNRLHFSDDGLLRDRDGKLITVTESNVVMDAEGNWYFDPATNDLSSAGHSIMAGGRPVAFAGKVSAQNGRLKLLTRDSGHYLPSIHYLLQAIESLERAKAFQRGRDDAIVSWGIEDPSLQRDTRE